MCNATKLPIVMIGGGGHASVLTEMLLIQGKEVVAVISPEDIGKRRIFNGIAHLKNNEDILAFDKERVLLVNGIGMAPKSKFRQKINNYFLSLGYKFETVIAHNAYISPFAKVEVGAQVFPMAIVQTGVTIGVHSIINSGALIEHDSRVGAYNHIAPKATLCGQVKTEDNVYIGSGSTIIQGLSIGKGAVVGAGVALTESLEAATIVYPARPTIKNIV